MMYPVMYTDFTKALFTFKMWYIFTERNVNVISFTIKEKYSVTFPVLILMKSKNAQQHYVHISYTKFHPDWTKNVENTYRNFLLS
jgi:uncharacterized membrane protein